MAFIINFLFIRKIWYKNFFKIRKIWESIDQVLQGSRVRSSRFQSSKFEVQGFTFKVLCGSKC
ncbi:MAG: hypothetical protein DRP92_03890 [Candidatus Neomarinimicrobiota bacterium]|nr:MAG: hypothetical protein DRP92_03890 [Candidatus Neomarinimicrobiota bacterium]